MTDRPILFSAPMVRAILDGRKTQTRRIVKPQPFASNAYHRGDIQASECAMRSTGDPVCFNFGVTAVDGEGGLIETIECHYGCPGDRLWVRETSRCYAAQHGSFAQVEYQADGKETRHPWPGGSVALSLRWRPSIHMPRWASRITLEITGVRVERLRQITGGDAVAEGYPHRRPETFGVDQMAYAYQAATDWYKGLWEQINGPGSWNANPWVWVVEFKRVMP